MINKDNASQMVLLSYAQIVLLIAFILGVLNTALISYSQYLNSMELLIPAKIITREVKEVELNSWVGIASYYTREGCIGCSDSLTMANGEPLLDEGYTVAFNKLPLNSWIRVTNLDNCYSVYAKVTDRGGFEELGRIIDLTQAVKDSIGCGDLCRVSVEQL